MAAPFTPNPEWAPIVSMDFFEADGRAFHKKVEEFREAIKNRPRDMSLVLDDGWHLIIPQMAEQLLMRNTRNRPLDWPYVLAYGTHMVNKRWKKTGEPVIINGSGDVDDAGHRLWACYLSGAPFKTYVVNVEDDPDLFPFIDSGRSRSASDALTTAGVGDQSRLVAQIIKNFAMPFDEQCLTYNGRLSVHPCTNIDVLDYVRANPLMTEIIRMVGDTYPAAVERLYNRKVACFVGWKIHTEHGAATLDQFFTDLTRTDFGTQHPIAVLQRRLDAHIAARNAARSSPKRKDVLTPTKILALTIRAFNFWIAGQNINRLDPRADDPFPEFAEPQSHQEAAD